MGASLFWGAVSASSLLIGAVLGVTRTWNARALGLVLGFGAGALISGVAFQLTRGGFQAAGPWPITIGLAAGALVFFFADRAVEQWAIRTGGMAGCRWRWAACSTASPSKRFSASGCPTGRACPSPC
jgi:ZIP family zinc transporter